MRSGISEAITSIFQLLLQLHFIATGLRLTPSHPRATTPFILRPVSSHTSTIGGLFSQE